MKSLCPFPWASGSASEDKTLRPASTAVPRCSTCCTCRLPSSVLGQGRACRGRAGDGASPSDSCQKRCSAEDFRVVPIPDSRGAAYRVWRRFAVGGCAASERAGAYQRSRPADGLDSGKCHKTGADRGEPAQHWIERAQDPRGHAPPRVVDRAARGLDYETGLLSEVSKFICCPKATPAPEPRAEPSANSAPRCPRAPLAKFADDEAPSGSQHARDLLEDGGGVVDKAQDGDRRHHVELSGWERKMLRYLPPESLCPCPEVAVGS
jgi:hypothetical protein